MILKLFHRHHGIHVLIKETLTDVPFDDIVVRIPDKPINQAADDYIIKEDALLRSIPENFLLCSANKILLSVSDSDGNSSGQINLKIFKNWAKYFDAYCLELSNYPVADSMP